MSTRARQGQRDGRDARPLITIIGATGRASPFFLVLIQVFLVLIQALDWANVIRGGSRSTRQRRRPSSRLHNDLVTAGPDSRRQRGPPRPCERREPSTEEIWARLGRPAIIGAAPGLVDPVQRLFFGGLPKEMLAPLTEARDGIYGQSSSTERFRPRRPVRNQHGLR